MPVYNASTKELLVQHNNALYIGDLRVFNLPSKKLPDSSTTLGCIQQQFVDIFIIATHV